MEKGDNSDYWNICIYCFIYEYISIDESEIWVPT